MAEWEALILLQKVFDQSCETERQMRELEEKLEQIEACVQYREGLKRKEETEQQIREIRAQARQKKLDLETAKEREAEKKALLSRVTSPRELQALETQLKAAEKFRATTDEELLELEEKLEELTQLDKELTDELPRLQEAAAQERRAAEENLEELRLQQSMLEQEMARIRQMIKESLLREFDRLVNCRGGMAVVPLVDESRCGACGLALPMCVVVQIADNELVQCESCGRFIVNEQAFESVIIGTQP